LRIHPLLHWTEIDIWRYCQREKIPCVDLYFAKDGKRYRSLGDQDITSPVASEAATLDEIITELETTRVAERSGRAMDHEVEDACAPKATCERAPDGHARRPPQASDRDRRPRRSRQVDPGRPAVPRHRVPA